MKKIILSLLLGALSLSMLTGCGSSNSDTEASTDTTTGTTEEVTTDTTTEATAEEDFQVAIVLPGSISDAGWNASGYLAVQSLNEEGNISAEYVENVSATDAEAAFRDYASKGYDLLLGWSYDYADAISDVAADYPDTKFVESGYGIETTENIATFDYSLTETAYLCGMVAGYMTKTNTIGYIGAMETSAMNLAYNGYAEGAKVANPDINILYTIVGSWSDVDKASQATTAQIEQGADVIMSRGDGITIGSINVCKDEGVYMFGDVTDQNELAPDIILTSTALDLAKIMEICMEDIKNGEFANKSYTFGMIDGVCDITDYHGLVPDDIAEKVEVVREQLKSGELTLEQNYEAPAAN